MRFLVHGLGDEAWIAWQVQAAKCSMRLQLSGDRSRDDMVILALAVRWLGLTGRSLCLKLGGLSSGFFREPRRLQGLLDHVGEFGVDLPQGLAGAGHPLLAVAHHGGFAWRAGSLCQDEQEES